jgi:hypothetical protein
LYIHTQEVDFSYQKYSIYIEIKASRLWLDRHDNQLNRMSQKTRRHNLRSINDHLEQFVGDRRRNGFGAVDVRLEEVAYLLLQLEKLPSVRIEVA